MPGAALLLLIALTIACERVDRVPAPSVPPASGSAVSRALEITAGTQGQFGDLRIALGAVREADAADERGAKPLEASVYVFVRTDSSKNLTRWMRAGEALEVAGYSLFVEEVRTAGRGSVLLRITGSP